MYLFLDIFPLVIEIELKMIKICIEIMWLYVDS